MTSTRLAWFGAAALAATACGGSSADPEEVAEDLAAEVCDLSFRCCTRGEVNFFLGPFVEDEENCVDRLVQSANVSNIAFLGNIAFGDATVILPNLHALDQAVNDGRTEVDRDAVDECIAYLQEFECNELVEPPLECIPPELNPPDPCDLREMFHGIVPEGGRCSSPGFSFECEDDLVCRATGALGTDGACVQPGAEGDFCFSDGECQFDLYCSQFDGTCKVFGQPGDVCAYSDPDDPAPDPNTLLIKCDEGLSCDPVSDTCVAPCERGASCVVPLDCDAGAGLLCVDNRCEEPRGEGLPCELHEHCEEGLRCLESEAQFGVFLCSEPLPLGADCLESTGDLDCESGYCGDIEPSDGIGFGAGVCTESLDAGEACLSGLHEECFEGYCDNSDTINACSGSCIAGCDEFNFNCAPYCVPERAEGQSCTFDYQCSVADEANCIAGNCRIPPLGDGDDCELDEQCTSLFCSADGICDNPPLPNGKGCNDHEECESGVCDFFEGICTPGLQEGSECGEGTPCGRDLYCDPEESPPQCASVKDTGEVCKFDYQCRGSCVESWGRLACDPTPPINTAVCDGSTTE